MNQNRPIRCPNCGSQARMEWMSTSTLLAYTRSFDESGKETTVDPNTSTTHWTCSDCGENYVSYSQAGKIYQVR